MYLWHTDISANYCAIIFSILDQIRNGKSFLDKTRAKRLRVFTKIRFIPLHPYPTWHRLRDWLSEVWFAGTSRLLISNRANSSIVAQENAYNGKGATGYFSAVNESSCKREFSGGWKFFEGEKGVVCGFFSAFDNFDTTGRYGGRIWELSVGSYRNRRRIILFGRIIIAVIR